MFIEVQKKKKKKKKKKLCWRQEIWNELAFM